MQVSPPGARSLATVWALRHLWALIFRIELHAGRFGRFDPRTERWIEYVLPEPFAHNRRTWIDNSTDPVTVWYADHEGYMVRLQPLE